VIPHYCTNQARKYITPSRRRSDGLFLAAILTSLALLLWLPAYGVMFMEDSSFCPLFWLAFL
uniref:hypothetical protein n=1 Tax=Kozakia baliensis TaxID=153496 RepID=UPI00055CF047